MANFIVLTPIPVAPPPTKASQVVIYTKSDGLLYQLSSAGVETPIGIPAGGSAGQVLKKIDGTDYNVSWQSDLTGGGGASVAWGAITGTLSDQGDLNTSLAGKAASSHNHNASDLNAGTVAAARLGSGTADVNNFLRGDSTYGKTWNAVTKTSDTTRTSTTAISNDPDLVLSVSASKTYIIRIGVFYSVVTNAHGFRWRLVGPASPTLIRFSLNHTNPDSGFTGITGSAFDAADIQGGIVSAGEGFLFYEIGLQNGANAGTISISWAQGTSSGNATILRGGSYIEYIQMN